MKNQLLYSAIVAIMALACQHDSVEQVTPSMLSHLSVDEMKIASSVGRLVKSSEAFTQATDYQQANPNSVFAVPFNRKTIEAILSKDHVVGLRAYYIKNSEGKLDLALVGMDKDLNNAYINNTMFSEGSSISEDEFKRQTSLFQLENPNSIRAVAFGSQLISDILSQSDCAGIRFYFTTDKDGNKSLIFVGFNSHLKDIRSNPNARSIADGGDTGGDGYNCPQHCPK